MFAFFDIELGSKESVVARRKVNRASWPDFLPPSPKSMRRGFTFSSQSEDSYGLQLLSGVSSDIQLQETSGLIMPIAVLRSTSSGPHPDNAAELQHHNHLLPDPQLVSKCLDAGAWDVLTTPLEKARVQGLAVLACRTLKTAQRQQSRFLGRRKSRKHSWVGVHNEKPYAYLREAMYVIPFSFLGSHIRINGDLTFHRVSKLMKGICNPEDTIEEFQDRYARHNSTTCQRPVPFLLTVHQGTGNPLRARKICQGTHWVLGFHGTRVHRRRTRVRRL